MDEIKFIKRMVGLRPPRFSGIGIQTHSKSVSIPRNSGCFFLCSVLSGKKVNGKIVFTNEPIGVSHA